MIIEDNLKIARLIDTYGELLTSKQLEIMTSYYFDNLTLTEIGDNYNISRQAVSDCLSQATKILDNYENKLLLIKKSDNLKLRLNNLRNSSTNDDVVNVISEIMEMLDE